jgi:hypothetical protein
MSPAHPCRKMQVASGYASSTAARNGPGKSVFHNKVWPAIEVGWQANDATIARGPPSAFSTTSTGTDSSTGAVRSTRLTLMPSAMPIPEPTFAGRRSRCAA